MTMTLYIILSVIVLVAILAMVVLKNEQKIVEKAQSNKNMFNFYHMLALMTSSTYKGYIESKEEKKAMEEYLNGRSEYDAHPVGSYLKMCEENKKMLQSVTYPSYNKSELGIGFAVMFIFVVTVILGVTLS